MEPTAARSNERTAGLALYRAYRPGTLAQVIGQDHITVPLARAVDSGRAHHAYLFTGPRGCGKTSSARILARCLNCEQGPTSTPCGACTSCVDLAPNGPGSVDVLEIDAATHGGVDEARELRERAVFAPVQSRYRVYIVDEAHQLSNAAANALLKLIEEPPAHLKFVFATTEPDKIIGTIRSRTHHYPFRLIPARVLQEHLAWVCEQEGVAAEIGALAVVARAAAGSARDALSVLGQVMAGAGEQGLVESEVVAQLGVTDRRILDELVMAVATSEAASVFNSVTRVLDGGTEPRRFAADLLERLRDLVLLASVPEHDARELIDAPDAAFSAMCAQAKALGAVQASSLARIVSEGIADLRGAMAPRLQLELLCAQLLLPQHATQPATVVAAPQPQVVQTPNAGASDAAPTSSSSAAVTRGRSASASPATAAGDAASASTSDSTASAAAAPGSTSPASRGGRAVPAPPPAISTVKSGQSQVAQPAVDLASATDVEVASVAAPAPLGDPATVVSRWADVVAAIGEKSRVSWSLLNGSAAAVHADALQVALPSAPLVANARQRALDEVVRSTVTTLFGIDLRVEFVVAAAGSATVDDAAGARDDDDVVPTGPLGVEAVTKLLGGTIISDSETSGQP